MNESSPLVIDDFTFLWVALIGLIVFLIVAVFKKYYTPLWYYIIAIPVAFFLANNLDLGSESYMLKALALLGVAFITVNYPFISGMNGLSSFFEPSSRFERVKGGGRSIGEIILTRPQVIKLILIYVLLLSVTIIIILPWPYAIYLDYMGEEDPKIYDFLGSKEGLLFYIFSTVLIWYFVGSLLSKLCYNFFYKKLFWNQFEKKKKAVKLPDFLQRGNSSRLYISKNEIEEAIKTATESIKKGDYEDYYIRASLNFHIGNYEKAEIDFDKIIASLEGDNLNKTAKKLLSAAISRKVMIKIGNKAFEESISLLKNAESFKEDIREIENYYRPKHSLKTANEMMKTLEYSIKYR